MHLGDRSLFPDLHGSVYLNHAGIAPASTRVQRAAMAPILDNAQRGSHAVMRWIDQRQHLKQRLGVLIGAPAECIALVPSTSRGVMDLALCMPWRPGERILCFDGEFPTNVTPWQRAAETFGLSVALLPLGPFSVSHAAGLASLRDALRTPTRLVAVSAVQFQTGLRMPLAEIAAICHEAGAELAVDAIQMLGVVPFAVGAVDYLVCGSHKWLMGLEGCGFVYARPDRAARLVPRTASWLSHEDPVRFLFEGPGQLRYDRPIRHSIDFLEMGVTNSVGFAALEAAVDTLLELGVDAIFKHVQGLIGPLGAGLTARGFESARTSFSEGHSGILSVRPPAPFTHAMFAKALDLRGITAGTPDGWLRLSPHWPNDAGQMGTLLQAVDEILAEGPR